MNATLSANAKAILLLTAPLITGRGKTCDDLLSPSEYKTLAMRIRQAGGQPSDLLTSGAHALLTPCAAALDRARLERLLARGFQLSQAVERWQTRAIWVVSRADPAYPKRLKARLKEDSPAVLYGCGDAAILDRGGLAVVGSRNVDDALIEYTESIGRLTAAARRTLVSGGARGIDQAAMRGALDAGGMAIGVLADNLERAAMTREHRTLLMDRQLVLISPYDPNARFLVGHAMQRNKLTYALADAALVVNSDREKGGTWAGATEQLSKLRLVPVYVRTTGAASDGLAALTAHGALPWPEPEDADGLNAALGAPGSSETMPPADLLAFPRGSTAPSQANSHLTAQSAAADDIDRVNHRVEETTVDSAKALFASVRALLLNVVQVPRSAAEVTRDLDVTRRQAEDWLRRLVEAGDLDRSTQPVRYCVRRRGLFDTERGDDSRRDAKAAGSKT